MKRPQDWIVVFTDDEEQQDGLAEQSDEKLREIFASDSNSDSES